MSSKLDACIMQRNEKQTYECLYAHSPDRLSLSLTESWVMSSVGSSLRYNRGIKTSKQDQLLSWSFPFLWQSSTVQFLVPGTLSTKNNQSVLCSIWNSSFTWCTNRPWLCCKESLLSVLTHLTVKQVCGQPLKKQNLYFIYIYRHTHACLHAQLTQGSFGLCSSYSPSKYAVFSFIYSPHITAIFKHRT